ncbi:MAG: homoserine dehydrogenase [Gemmatimonadaceae bacterium]|nr:homoserine dehydrogenase [Gemmatimonadaceae bacterium]
MATPVLRLGLIGFGTVGQAFARGLAQSADRLASRLSARIRLARVAVRVPQKVQPAWPDLRIGDDPLALASDPSVDIVVEATGADTACGWLTTALNRGAVTVSANKQAVAGSLPLLQALADRHPLFHCEGAVAAAIPIVRALREGLDGEDILDIRGILNGTSTFILSEVERGAEFAAAFARAESLGFAERGSRADIDGSDAAAKLAILASTAWRTPIVRERVRVRGFDERIVAQARQAFGAQRRVRLVAEAWQADGPRLIVEPRVLDGDDPLATVTGVTNAVELTAVLAGQLRWFGPGAGGDRTASALLGDVLAGARTLLSGGLGRVAA